MLNIHMILGGEILNSEFSNGEGEIWLSNIQCPSQNTFLINCMTTPFGVYDCSSHTGDVGIRCCMYITDA